MMLRIETLTVSYLEFGRGSRCRRIWRLWPCGDLAVNEHSDHTIHLYDANSRPGGHANTVQFMTPEAKNDPLGINVDTGSIVFIIFNPTTYPNFLRFLRMHPATRGRILQTEMTFSVSCNGAAFEWAGKNLATVFCQLRNLLEPGMWRLVWDVARFNACAGRVLAEKEPGKERSIGEYLCRERYSFSFRDNYLISMTAAIWSTPPDKCAMDFPARTLNSILTQPPSSPNNQKAALQNYVNQLLLNLSRSQLHLSTRVQSIETQGHTAPKITLNTSNGTSEAYDHVIFACHSDTVLKILRVSGEGGKTQEEEILGAFEWSKIEVVLHSDDSLMPRSRIAWSCWNYLTHSAVDSQGRKKANEDTVSLYDHPVLGAKAAHAQKQMHKIQGKRGISYADAYLHYGFHEDGCTSGLVAAAALSSRGAPGFDEQTKSEVITARPPFRIEYAEKEVKRTVLVVVLAALFDLVKTSGVRWLVGMIGSAMLSTIKWGLGYMSRPLNVLEISKFSHLRTLKDLAHLDPDGQRFRNLQISSDRKVKTPWQIALYHMSWLSVCNFRPRKAHITHILGGRFPAALIPNVGAPLSCLTFLRRLLNEKSKDP